MPILVRPLKSDDQYTNTSYDYQITQEIKYGTPSPTMLLTNKCANILFGSQLELILGTRSHQDSLQDQFTAEAVLPEVVFKVFIRKHKQLLQVENYGNDLSDAAKQAVRDS
ncbi:Hypothetical_protein [Hexamita inflata]|uniref:Hypothetical_protein n=1 Tax=Hexamita inflata TaxID=28002 RepID=A0AA86URT4_9EUKA|nr:Hypothetical protein HINF_LOCUS49997 [Hexamita inflata]